MWTDDALVYVVAVLSARDNRARRQAGRSVWLADFRRQSVAHGVPSRVVFVVGGGARGSAKAAAADAELLAEQQRHRDLMFVDVEDTYHTSAQKMLGFYRQLHRGFGARCEAEDRARCPRPFVAVIKMDDDAAVLPTAVPALAAAGFLDPLRSPAPRWHAGFRANKVPLRDGPRAIPRADWAADLWPVFAGGPGHVLNWAFVDWLGRHALALPTHVWMEDAAHGVWFDLPARATPADAGRACRLFDDRFPLVPFRCSASSITTGAVMGPGDRSDRERLAAMVAAYHRISGAPATTPEPNQTMEFVIQCRRRQPDITREESGSSPRTVAQELMRSLERRAARLSRIPPGVTAGVEVGRCARCIVRLAAAALSAHLNPALRPSSARPNPSAPPERVLQGTAREAIEICGPSGNMTLTLGNSSAGDLPLHDFYSVSAAESADSAANVSSATDRSLCTEYAAVCDGTAPQSLVHVNPGCTVCAGLRQGPRKQARTPEQARGVAKTSRYRDSRAGGRQTVT